MLDVWRRIAPKKRQDRHALFQTNSYMFLYWKMQNKIYTKWFVREFAHTPDLGAKLIRRCKLRLQNANPPALLTAATNSGPVRSGPIGAAMIGCSIPSR